MYLRINPYQELLEGMVVALQVNEGIIKLTGRPGAGKTALCQQLRQELSAHDRAVLYFATAPRSAIEVQQGILRELGLGGTGNFSKVLEKHLLALPAGRRELYVIFDEAQLIDLQAFECIRMLCNLLDGQQALVKPILCGSPELDRKLAAPEFRSIAQYLSQGFTLPPMTIEQLKDFYWAFWSLHGIQLQPPSHVVITNLFKESQGFPGPALARLEHAYAKVLQRREGRGVEDEVPGLLLPPVRKRRPAELWLGLSFAGLLLAAGGWMFHLYRQVERTPVMSTAAVQDTLGEPLTQAEPEAVAVPGALVETQSSEAPVEALPIDSLNAADEIAVVGIAAPEAMAETTEVHADSEPDAATTLTKEAPETDPGSATSEQVEIAAAADEPSADAAPAPAPVEAAPAAAEPDIPAAEVDFLLAAWTERWAARDVDGYLGYYDPAFQPATGDSLQDWQNQRRGSIGRAGDIRITHDAPLQLLQDGDSITVQFWLRYRASNYSDDTLKELVLQRGPEGLRILAERNLQVERVQ